MKIKSLLIGMLASTAFVACTNDVETVENGAVAKGEKGYVSVNIVTPGSVGSRATGDFVEGTPQESAVRDAIFLFLDGNYKGCANPYYVSRDLGWDTEGVRDDQTKKATVLVVDGVKDEVPAYIVAILNPINKNAYSSKTSLKDLKAEYANYSSAKNGGYLVMSNAVYSAENGKEVVATPITLDNIAESQDALADVDPVTIQVERTVGKVAVAKLNDAIAELNANGLKETIDDKEDMKLKFVLTGWEVLQNNATNLIKNIDASNWTIKNWNALNLQRSYWANDNTSKGRTEYLAESLTGKDAEFKYVEETVNQTATEQSALNSVSPYLLVSGKFVNQNDQPVDLVEWRGQKYTKKGYLNLIAGMSEISQYYTAKEVTEDGVTKTKYTSFTADLLKLQDNTENDWGSTAVLKDETTQFYTVTFEADGKTVKEGKPANIADVKAAIAEFGEVKYWDGGNTYYFVPIKHQSATAATTEEAATNFYGVVRNHVYQMNITKINGYGTPVSDPNQAIDEPENPEEGNTYMQAEVVILDWRVVENNVELN